MVGKYKEHLDEVLKIMGTSLNEVCSDTRKESTRILRQCVQYWLRQNTFLSLNQIAFITNRKSHNTIHHSCKVIEEEFEFYKKYHKVLKRYEQYLSLEGSYRSYLAKENKSI